MSLEDRLRRTILTLKVLSGSLIIASGSYLGLISLQFNAMNSTRKNLESYLVKNHKKILKETEKRFNIKYDKVNYAVKSYPRLSLAGQYFPSIDYFFINRNHPFTALDRNDTGLLSYFFTQQTVKGTFIHESGHDYTFQVMKKLLGEKKLHPKYGILFFEGMRTSKEEAVKYSLVIEGIGEYFQRMSREDEEGPELPTVVWPSSLDQFFRKEEGKKYHSFSANFYNYGYAYVKPILDKLGVKKGITMMYSNPPPTLAEILSPKKYQDRILKAGKN